MESGGLLDGLLGNSALAPRGEKVTKSDATLLFCLLLEVSMSAMNPCHLGGPVYSIRTSCIHSRRPKVRGQSWSACLSLYLSNFTVSSGGNEVLTNMPVSTPSLVFIDSHLNPVIYVLLHK